MKIRRKAATISGGVPKKTGGYNYSTDASQNTLFNQGLDPRSNPPERTGGYDYSAKGQAAAMHRIRGVTPPNPVPVNYGTALNKANKAKRVNRALGNK